MHLFATLASYIFSSEYANVDKWESASYMLSKLCIYYTEELELLTSVLEEKS